MTKTLEELQEIGYKIACGSKPNVNTAKKLPTGDSACYKFWKENKWVGVPYDINGEYDVAEGGKAIVTSIGYVVYWDGTTTKAL